MMLRDIFDGICIAYGSLTTYASIMGYSSMPHGTESQHYPLLIMGAVGAALAVGGGIDAVLRIKKYKKKKSLESCLEKLKGDEGFKEEKIKEYREIFQPLFDGDDDKTVKNVIQMTYAEKINKLNEELK